MKTKKQTKIQKIEEFISSIVDLDGRETARPGVLGVYECFKSEYGYMIERVGESRAFYEWLHGVPGSLDIDIYYYDQRARLAEFGEIHPRNLANYPDSLIAKSYFNRITTIFFKMVRKAQKQAK